MNVNPTFPPDVQAVRGNVANLQQLKPFTTAAQINVRKSMEALQRQTVKSSFQFSLMGLMTGDGA